MDLLWVVAGSLICDESAYMREAWLERMFLSRVYQNMCSMSSSGSGLRSKRGRI
jgi:hypothetical protein